MPYITAFREKMEIFGQMFTMMSLLFVDKGLYEPLNNMYVVRLVMRFRWKRVYQRGELLIRAIIGEERVNKIAIKIFSSLLYRWRSYFQWILKQHFDREWCEHKYVVILTIIDYFIKSKFSHNNRMAWNHQVLGKVI